MNGVMNIHHHQRGRYVAVSALEGASMLRHGAIRYGAGWSNWGLSRVRETSRNSDLRNSGRAPVLTKIERSAKVGSAWTLAQRTKGSQWKAIY